MDIRLEMADGSNLEAHIIPLDLVKLERATGIPYGRMAQDLKAENALILGWIVAKRLGITDSLDWEEWSEGVRDYGLAELPLPSGSADAPSSPPREAEISTPSPAPPSR